MKKNLILNVSTALCLSLVLVSALPMNSIQQYEEYDPWMDIDDNGIINMLDLYYVSLRFGATGDPINKTDLLLQLLDRVDELNSTVIEQQNTINNLNQTVQNLNYTLVELNETVILMNGTGLGRADFDSGWVPSPMMQWVTITHNLNRSASQLLVYLIGRYWDGSTMVVNQICYGTEQYIYPGGETYRKGVHWESHDNRTISIWNCSFPREDYNMWKEVRVFIWIIP